MGEQISVFSDNPEYEAFVEKFKPKKPQTIVTRRPKSTK
jgi:hypothetical protein